MLGGQQPKAHRVALNLVGQQLPHAAFDTRRVARLFSGVSPGALRFDLWFTLAARATLVEFFLKAILGDHPFDAPGADFETCLAKLLANHIGRSVRIEKAVPNHLSHQFAGSPVVGLGAP